MELYVQKSTWNMFNFRPADCTYKMDPCNNHLKLCRKLNYVFMVWLWTQFRLIYCYFNMKILNINFIICRIPTIYNFRKLQKKIAKPAFVYSINWEYKRIHDSWDWESAWVRATNEVARLNDEKFRKCTGTLCRFACVEPQTILIGRKNQKSQSEAV